jgi:hypothetical protein
MSCDRCGRPYQEQVKHEFLRGDPAYVYYNHSYYGCDSGCCGHRFYVADADGRVLSERFEFTHDEEAVRENAEAMAHHWGVPVRADKCEYSDD